jgi:hypothetical protein
MVISIWFVVRIFYVYFRGENKGENQENAHQRGGVDEFILEISSMQFPDPIGRFTAFLNPPPPGATARGPMARYPS